jgi:hypothetical protein
MSENACRMCSMAIVAAQRGRDFVKPRHHPGHGAHGALVPIAAAALQMSLMTAGSGMGRDDDGVAWMYAWVTGTHCQVN